MTQLRQAACQMLLSYKDVPFHGPDHGDEVMVNIIRMGYENDVELLLSTAGHDIDHTFAVQSDDEVRAARISHGIGKKFGIDIRTRNSVEHLILGTVFPNRSKISGKQEVIADADVANVGGDFHHHMRCTARLIMETHAPTGRAMTRDVIMSGFQRNIGFYAFLTGITGNPDNPFLTPEAQKAFPHFPRNRDIFLEKLANDPEYFIRTVQQEWRNFFGAELVLIA